MPHSIIMLYPEKTHMDMRKTFKITHNLGCSGLKPRTFMAWGNRANGNANGTRHVIFFCLSGAGSREQQTGQGCPDFPRLQLFRSQGFPRPAEWNNYSSTSWIFLRASSWCQGAETPLRAPPGSTPNSVFQGKPHHSVEETNIFFLLFVTYNI